MNSIFSNGMSFLKKAAQDDVCRFFFGCGMGSALVFNIYLISTLPRDYLVEKSVYARRYIPGVMEERLQRHKKGEL